MTTPLDVLLIESHAGSADAAERALEQAGHRVHRCHRPGDRDYACTEMTEPGTCPLNRSMDVALLVRREVAPTPTHLEDGVRCAVRAHVPVVEAGPETLDPFDPWIAGRVTDGDVVGACQRAAERTFAPLEREVLRRIDALLAPAGLTDGAVTCRVRADWPRLLVHLDVDGELEASLHQALAVRALDAIRSRPGTFGTVDVKVSGAVSGAAVAAT